MIPDHLAEFWTAPRLATLGTVRADGSAHLVPVKCMRAADAFVVMTRRETLKVRHVNRTGRASLAEHTSTLWATVEGPARIDDDPALVAVARAAYLDRFGRPETWGDCVLVVAPERVLFGE